MFDEPMPPSMSSVALSSVVRRRADPSIWATSGWCSVSRVLAMPFAIDPDLGGKGGASDTVSEVVAQTGTARLNRSTAMLFGQPVNAAFPSGDPEAMDEHVVVLRL